MRLLAGAFLFFLAVLPGAAFAACGPERPPRALAGLADFARAVMAEWQVPGLALGVIANGETVYCAGFGLSDAEANIAATPETVFAIGSISKSFTVAGLGLLAAEGRLDWDRPARDYLPGFALADPVAAAETTPRDMISHRTGLARHDMLWYQSGLDADELFARLQYLEPGAPFRAGWQDNNLMVAAAGRLVPAITGESWQDFTARRLLAPLGMTATDFTPRETDTLRAKPYETDAAGGIRRIPFYDMAAIAPAGGLNSTAADMLAYLALHMNLGRHGGARLLPEAAARAMQTPSVALGEAAEGEFIGAAAYGMGFFLSTYRGHPIVWHAGGVDGFVALLAFLPEDGIGVVALSNLDRNPAPTLLARRVFDRLLGLAPLPWNDWVASDYLAWELRQRQKAARHAGSRDTSVPPSRPLTEFAGRYRHPAYGEARIVAQDGALTLRWGRLALPLRHYRGDIFEIVKIPTTSRSHLAVAFRTDENGEITDLTVPFERDVADIVFARITPRR
jgi:CubicO group peptidase (beta-lactamase class C family)